ncbi:membrane-spanning 4-domains subfamily A member 8-like [Molossus molossus]|uniref:Membrane spanning 4-domains A8 n=1 Tax=Molossus molossus TaxID=27622 RepID=A0A7J8ES18_MOLMO|nr:membrane-spanning 4-domains subfamily A member 8-like [Molossus molossus]KAF6438297.1 membrane spanning 4-domains A8 [Molossus molossus]
MTSMTSTGPMANSVFVIAPHNRYPVTLGGMTQVPVYPFNQTQVHPVPGNAHGLELPTYMQPAQRTLREGKVLGAIQILIGLVHIGLGSILGTIVSTYYIPVSLAGGYPFWGGIWFIITGSLTVSSEVQPNSPCLLKGSLGLNIISAVCSLVGIALFITDMSVNSARFYPNYYPYYGVAPGIGTSAVLFIFSLLEFSIACTCTQFGCQLVQHSQNNGTVVMPPTIYVTNPMVIPEPGNSPPPYSG